MSMSGVLTMPTIVMAISELQIMNWILIIINWILIIIDWVLVLGRLIVESGRSSGSLIVDC